MNFKVSPPAPLVPGLGNDNAIDLDALGSDDIVTYVQYPELAQGHIIAPQWRGRTYAGETVDESNRQVVDERLELDDDGQPRMPIAIDNASAVALAQGEVFYSYSYSSDGGTTFSDESQRLFFYVGKRSWMSSLLLPVAHLKESHDLYVDTARVPTSGATVLTAPYQAMAVGDELEFVWVAYRATGGNPTTHRLYKTVAAEEVGRPLEWTLSRVQLVLIQNGGHGVMSYNVTYADPVTPNTSSTRSAEQRIRGMAPDAPLLAALSITGHAGGTIDPSVYPLGVPLRIPTYPGLQVGDSVMLYAEGDSPAYISRQLDVSNVESGIINLLLDAQWLQAHYGKAVSLSYAYARAGASLRSEPLNLTVRRELRLLPPVVDKAVPYDADGSGINKGWVNPSDVLSGALIDIPEQAEIGPDDQRWVLWSGHGGEYPVESPISGSSWRYKVPADEIPADLGKRVLVKYAVQPAGEDSPYWSPLFDLEIRDFEGGWPELQAENPRVSVAPNGISLSAVGAFMVFKLGSWRFMNEGQLLKIRAEGIEQNSGQTIEYVLRSDSEPLSEDEYYDGAVLPELPRTFLESLRIGEEFDVSCEVSFDNGFSYKSFGIKSFRLHE